MRDRDIEFSQTSRTLQRDTRERLPNSCRARVAFDANGEPRTWESLLPDLPVRGARRILMARPLRGPSSGCSSCSNSERRSADEFDRNGYTLHNSAGLAARARARYEPRAGGP